MKKLKTTLSLALLTITTASCSSNLPADFPKPIAIDLCTPIVKPDIFDQVGSPLPFPIVFVKITNPDKSVSLKPVQLTATWVDCERTDSRERTSKPLNYIQYGISAGDWNRGQDYRRLVEEWAKKKGLLQ